MYIVYLHRLLLPGWLLCPGASLQLPHDPSQRSSKKQSYPSIKDRQIHIVRERPRDDTIHHSQTHMQRDTAYVDIHTYKNDFVYYT